MSDKTADQAMATAEANVFPGHQLTPPQGRSARRIVSPPPSKFDAVFLPHCQGRPIDAHPAEIQVRPACSPAGSGNRAISTWEPAPDPRWSVLLADVGEEKTTSAGLPPAADVPGEPPQCRTPPSTG